jgi:hypothetical protein
LAADVFLLSENDGTGLTWKTIGNNIDNYSVGICMGLTFVNILIFIVLAWYCE